MKNILGRILVLFGALLAAGCAQSGIETRNQLQQGDPIEVALHLSLARSHSVSRAPSATLSSKEGGIDVALSTRSVDAPSSKAVDDLAIANVWVLQFSGTEAGSTLWHKEYVADYVSGSMVPVLRHDLATRVAVVANTFDASWADGFYVGSTTWSEVLAASKTVAAQSDVLRSSGGTDYVPMSGSYVGVVGADPLAILLTRTVVQVVVHLKSGADLNATAFNVQLCGIPDATSWFVDRGLGVWPVAPTAVSYAAQEVAGISTTDYSTLTYWVPVNRRGVVADATRLTRATKAPLGSTYLGVVANGFHYTLHLGGDFSTDYNLAANTIYTYHLTLLTDPLGTDSRVSDLRALGTLTQTPANNIAAEGAAVTIASPSASTGLVWSAALSNTTGFTLGSVTGVGPLASVPVTVGLNPTSAVRSSTLTATSTNGLASSLELTQAAASLRYVSASAATPVAGSATSVTFTVTGTAGLTLSFAKSSGDAAFSVPATLTCNGTEQTVTVTMAANTGAARQAVYTATVTNAGASGLDLTDITVKARPINPPAASDYVKIDKLYWTKGNLVAVNSNECKVGAATDYGVYFQFGSLVGWTGGASGNGVGTGSPGLAVKVKPAGYSGGTAWTTVGYYKEGTENDKDYNLPLTDAPTTGIGDPCRYYLGAPWRTPTAAEYATLDGLGRGAWVTSPGAGRWFGLNPGTASSSVFFPASGTRDSPDGALVNVGSICYLWSSSVNDVTNGYDLRFFSSSVSPQYNNNRSNGMPVRCVSYSAP